jgi:predicted TIM-barrel fold metal-dependent hydrolase
MDRRDLLKMAAAFAGGVVAQDPAQAFASAVPVIDTHIHLFDPTRPGGVPWPEKTDAAIYRTTLPDRYQSVAGPLGVVGAVVVEASPLASDNDWVLRVAARYPIIVGLVGDLIPGTADYAKQLDRLHANPLFLGIRCGNIWNRDLSSDLDKPEFLPGLKLLAERGLTLDSANPDMKLLQAIARISARVPQLRIVIDHLPSMKVPADPKEYWRLLHELAGNKNIYVKLSEVEALRSELGAGPGFYKETLDGLWNVFGEDHVLYASDWPNSDHHATYLKTITILRDYAATKSRSAQEKFFAKNSLAAYRWHSRDAAQAGVI